MTEVNLPGLQCACVEVLERLKKSPRGLQRAAEDKQLANAINDLLEASYELETFHPSSAISSPITPPDDPAQATSPYLRLVHILETVQRAAAQRPPRADISADEVDLLHPAVHAVREDLAWARVESLSHAVVQLVQRRRESPRASRALPARSPPPQSPLPAPPSPSIAPRRRMVSGASAISAASSAPRTALPSPSLPPSLPPQPSQHGMSSSHSTLVREAAASKTSLASAPSVQSLQSLQSLSASATEGPVHPVHADSDTVASVIERLQRIAPHHEGEWRHSMDMQELDEIIDRVDRLDIGQKANWTTRRQEKVSKQTCYEQESQRIAADAQRRQVLKDALQQTSAQLERGLSDCPSDNIARANELREVSIDRQVETEVG